MSRTLPAGIDSELSRNELRPALACEIETTGTPVRAWGGFGDLVLNGITYVGTGIFGKVSAVEETTDGRSAGLTYELSGIPQDLVSVSLQSIRQRLNASLYLAVLDPQGRLIGDMLRLDRGLTDVPELTDDSQTATIRLTTEKRSIDQQRARIRRYTTADQQIDDPTDTGFRYVPGLQDAKIVWGRAG